mmetsp:Transcript_9617/g.20683  ORF Transcript_9617/g.20683 Transcript_9617/m.20683 type:complete len:212 (-) Transcript_9617:625-1260(-)
MSTPTSLGTVREQFILGTETSSLQFTNFLGTFKRFSMITNGEVGFTPDIATLVLIVLPVRLEVIRATTDFISHVERAQLGTFSKVLRASVLGSTGDPCHRNRADGGFVHNGTCPNKVLVMRAPRSPGASINDPLLLADNTANRVAVSFSRCIGCFMHTSITISRNVGHGPNVCASTTIGYPTLSREIRARLSAATDFVHFRLGSNNFVCTL